MTLSVFQSAAGLGRLLAHLLTLVTGGCLLGCASLNPQPPIEAFVNKLADEALIPAVREGLSQGVEHLTVQTGVHGINPKYVVEFEGFWVIGPKGRASVGVEGVAGQLQISSTSTEKTERCPHAKEQDAPGDGVAAPDDPSPDPDAAPPAEDESP